MEVQAVRNDAGMGTAVRHRLWRVVAYAPRGPTGAARPVAGEGRGAAARAHSGRDVTPTQCARHSPRPHRHRIV